MWAGFAVMCLGMFMAILDIQIVATSLPTIQGALGIRPDQMSWVQTAYLIAEVVAIPLTGLLTRALTMRGAFALATGLFTLASAGCAVSDGFASLIAWRILQGFAGGTLIPAAFAAVFLLFPPRQHPVATTVVGIVAVTAPTLGPVVGGWITETYSWRWLFLINLAPGIVAVAAAFLLIPGGRPDWRRLKRLDLASLLLMTAALASLEIGLKEAPIRGWSSAEVLALFAAALAAGAAFAWRTWHRAEPLVDLRPLRGRGFAVGCGLSFLFGIGLFGAIYLMPVFLAFVRGHGSLRIGEIMLVTGAAQLVSAPLAVALALKVGARPLTAFGFGLLAAGCAMSALDGVTTDAAEMTWPQLVRGFAIMFCIVPPTHVALGDVPPDRVPDASGLFNLMRNLGGAIGLALVDTVLFGRAPEHAADLTARIRTGDPAALDALALPADLLGRLAAGPDPATLAALQPFIERAAFARSVGEAWAMLAAILVAGLVLVVALPDSRSGESSGPA